MWNDFDLIGVFFCSLGCCIDLNFVSCEWDFSGYDLILFTFEECYGFRDLDCDDQRWFVYCYVGVYLDLY